jgi:hypothetical protein
MIESIASCFEMIGGRAFAAATAALDIAAALAMSATAAGGARVGARAVEGGARVGAVAGGAKVGAAAAAAAAAAGAKSPLVAGVVLVAGTLDVAAASLTAAPPLPKSLRASEDTMAADGGRVSPIPWARIRAIASTLMLSITLRSLISASVRGGISGEAAVVFAAAATPREVLLLLSL